MLSRIIILSLLCLLSVARGLFSPVQAHDETHTVVIVTALGEIEVALDEGGYQFDRHLRVLRGRRRSSVDGEVPRDRSQTLLSETIVNVFEQLKEQGRPKENTRELRLEIRALLAQSLHPDLLSDGVIKIAVDEALRCYG